jgi:peptidyl-prolyl cis-trans isomerase C
MTHSHDEAQDEQVPFRLEGASGEGHRILVTAAKRRWLDEHLERQWRRPPTSAESDRFLADFVREEVLYREALALGLDRDDLVVRRRLVQKMEMLAIQQGTVVSESDVLDHYLAHRADYTVPESVSFTHVFFSASVRGADAHAAAVAVLGDVGALGASEASGLGDPSPAPSDVSDWTRPMVESRFGADFAAVVFEIETGSWSGPVTSAYGCHLVFVSQRSAARVPDLGEVADRIATELDTARRSGALDRVYANVREAYEVEIEPLTDDTASETPHVHHHDERTRA